MAGRPQYSVAAHDGPRHKFVPPKRPPPKTAPLVNLHPKRHPLLDRPPPPRKPYVPEDNERKWDLERGFALAARHSHAGGQIYDSRVFNHGAAWAPYSAATDPHCKKWVKQHRKAHPETAHTLAVQRERPLSSVPRSTLYHAQPQQLKKSKHTT